MRTLPAACLPFVSVPTCTFTVGFAPARKRDAVTFTDNGFALTTVNVAAEGTDATELPSDATIFAVKPL